MDKDEQKRRTLLAIREWILSSDPDIRSALLNLDGLVSALHRHGFKIVPTDQASSARPSRTH